MATLNLSSINELAITVSVNAAGDVSLGNDYQLTRHDWHRLASFVGVEQALIIADPKPVGRRLATENN